MGDCASSGGEAVGKQQLKGEQVKFILDKGGGHDTGHMQHMMLPSQHVAVWLNTGGCSDDTHTHNAY
jgi:hypothetical protein